MSEQTTEPLPCPFCGLPASIQRIAGSYGYTPNRSEIGCKQCGYVFAGKHTEEWEQGRGTRSTKESVEAELIAKWNRRASSQGQLTIPIQEPPR